LPHSKYTCLLDKFEAEGADIPDSFFDHMAQKHGVAIGKQAIPQIRAWVKTNVRVDALITT